MKKLKNAIDPHHAREAQKYDKPIPSREYIMQYLHERGRPARREELVEALNLKSSEEHEALRRRLRAMERDGQLVLTRRGGYGLAEKMDLLRGRVVGHRDGFGFIVPDDSSDDLFLNARQMRSVLHGDRVLVRVAGIDRKGRREAAIVEVLERTITSIVGRYIVESGVAFVVPDNKHINQDVLIPSDEQGLAQNGQIVVAEIISPPTSRKQIIGRVVEILGEHMAPGMEIEVAIRNYNIPYVWPEAVFVETTSLSTEISEQEKSGRIDLRHLSLVTIDGEDAKDFDDAVYCQKKTGGGWYLYVAIADVSHYVQPHTALDREALKRGNSVYFPGKVIPMLPEILSNDLCSLKPNVDRLCLVCEMAISNSGKLSRYRFYEAVMHSRARLTYTQVTAVLENPKKTHSQIHQQLIPHLRELHALYRVLRECREARGAIDFEMTETKVIFGPNRKIEQIVPAQRTVAHRIIEECMLMANVAAARFVIKQSLLSLFRVHAGPSLEKLQDLRDFLNGLGLRLLGSKQPKPQDYAQLLQSIVSRPDAHLIQTVLLRSLSQAVYSPDNIGHFGLAFNSYTHFTSPIRRYPDLLLHRIIRHALTGGRAETLGYEHTAMVNLGEHCSLTERRADEATREALDWLKCEFIQDRVGEEFDGLITNVTSFGLFIELQNIYVEGLLHVTALKNDYYHFDPIKHRLRGERTGVIYRLGDKLRVRVVRVNLESREIDFDLVELNTSRTTRTNKKSSKKATKKE